jgi:hypothetical protein
MKHHAPYIVLLPDTRTNPSKKHAVVHVDEWVAVSLGEKASYERKTEHEDYTSASREREWLNHRPEKFTVDEEEEITV